MLQIGGYVLAGGLSRRMGGRDKALLLHPQSGETMLSRTAALVRQAVGNVTILGPAQRYGHLGFPILEDLQADSGPLAGIFTALRQSAHERILVAPVDLPNLTAAFLMRLANEDGLCVIAQGQPLCGVYHRDCLPVIEAALASRNLRVTAVAAALQAREVAPDDPQMLENKNTPQDWLTP